jgi:hypothetical protein
LMKFHVSIITHFHGLSKLRDLVVAKHALRTWWTIFGPAITRIASAITPVSYLQIEAVLSACHGPMICGWPPNSGLSSSIVRYFG